MPRLYDNYPQFTNFWFKDPLFTMSFKIKAGRLQLIEERRKKTRLNTFLMDGWI